MLLELDRISVICSLGALHYFCTELMSGIVDSIPVRESFELHRNFGEH